HIKGLIAIDHMKNVGVVLPKETVDQLMKHLKTNFTETCMQYAKQALITKETAPDLVHKLLEDYGTMNPAVGIPLLHHSFNYASRQVALLSGLKQKLYLIHVDYTATNEESLKRYLGNNYELQSLQGNCHYPMLEKPVEFNTLLEKTLSKIKNTS
ncbi:MAG: hypothetical protein AAF734_06855, partial [Bacteroidota bacterium]